MKVEQKGHTTIIKDTESSFEVFLNKLTEQYNSFKSVNLIIDMKKEMHECFKNELQEELSKRAGMYWEQVVQSSSDYGSMKWFK